MFFHFLIDIIVNSFKKKENYIQNLKNYYTINSINSNANTYTNFNPNYYQSLLQSLLNLF